ncbi:helix-turn-helix domain-containing protein [Streptomyces sp. NPDC059852]|uniref:helix-turn-helix domain-containing protein n=1 Tax=Streptomyces sp. NPDC059852 TaxID=3346972 RepID=UPI003650E769
MSEVRDDVQEFAALLRRLKERTDRSYGQLARRLAMNTSTLHRYCAGEAVPLDFAPVERFAALCAATPEERLELHRLWILAVAARQRARTQGAKPAAEAPEPAQDETAEAPDEPAAAPAGPAPDVTPPLSPASARPRSRRRRLLVLTAAATALLAGLGTLAALPDDRPRGADRVQAADPARTTPAPTSRPSPPRSPAPTTTKASPSPTGSTKSAPREAGGTGAPKGTGRPKPAAGTPLAWSVDAHVWQAGCGHDYVLTRPPQQVPPPPPPQDARTWATSLGAVHGRQTMVRVSVQGRSSTAVVLEALRVRVMRRAAPLEGSVYAMDRGCGGALTPRFFDVDLDKDRPVARPQDGNDTGTPIPAMRLPYRVSATDPEVLLVTAQTRACDCSWYLELDWSSQGRTGTVRIDDAGRPFRTTGIGSLPRYVYETSDRAWVPYS